MDRAYTDTRFSLADSVKECGTGHYLTVIAFVGAGILLFGFVLASITARSGRKIDPGWSAKPAGRDYMINEIKPGGQAGGLLPGDRILSVAGDREAGIYGPALALSRVPAGSLYLIEVMREGARITVALPMGAGDPSDWHEFLPLLIVALLEYSIGAWIGIVRLDSATARLGVATFLLSSFAELAPVFGAFAGWSRATSSLTAVLAVFWRPWHLALGYHFLSVFPHPVREQAPAHWARRLVYMIAGLLWVPINAPVLAHMLGFPAIPLLAGLLPLQPVGQPGGWIMAGFESVAGGAMCFFLIRNYLRLPDPDSRRRIRWAAAGFGSALLVFVTVALLKLALYAKPSPVIEQAHAIVDNLGTLMVGISALTLGYAMVKHRVLGIHVMVRRGLQYLLARSALQLLILLPLLLILIQAIRNTDRSLNDLLFRSSRLFYLAVATTGAISLRYRRQMRWWLDRRFFRASLEQEELLEALIEHLKTAESEEEIAMIVSQELDHGLRLDGLHILLANLNDGLLRVAYSRLTDQAVRIRDYLNEKAGTRLKNGSMFTLYEIEDTGARRITSMRESLIVPVRGTDRSNLGVIVIGPRRSEEPYTNRDRSLLRAVAAQMAVMYEVLRLKERVQDERRVRIQVLGHLDQQEIQLLNECPDCGRCYTTQEEDCTHDGAKLSLTLPVERTIEGKYRLERRIGRGGMGIVYEATDIRLARPVAVKIMISDLFGDSAAMARFEREARAAALLEHNHIVRVHDYGKLAAGGAYLVMELVRGQSWREHMKSKMDRRADFTGRWISQLCSAVAAAHASGIVHRDIKPENLMIAEDDHGGRVVVLDFGLAKMRTALAQPNQDITVAGEVLGTRRYMSPEQRSGGPVDLRTDVYSIGVICTETITGVRPPRSGASLEWMRASLGCATSGETPLSKMLEQAMADSPSDRTISVAELGVQLPPAIGALGSGKRFGQDRADTKTLTIGAGSVPSPPARIPPTGSSGDNEPR
jgi:hypothetical protein